MMKFFEKVHWAAVDCLTGECSKLEQLPFEIGSGEGADLRLNGQGVAERHCAINRIKGHGLCLIKQEPNLPLIVDGQEVEYCALSPEVDYTVRIGNHFLAIRGGRDVESWLRGLDCSQWSLYDATTSQVDGPMSFDDLCRLAKERQRHPQTVVQPAGLSKGFSLGEALEVLAARQAAAGSEAGGAALEEELGRSGPGLLTCPVCWLKFDLGDIMHVAVHDSLRGDPVLGEDAQQRFLATRFNDRGQAVDALGLPCTDTACPHCRRILPPGFTEMSHHIISMVGDQSAGKSYFLSVLLKALPESLFEHFSVVFQDADPVGNAVINQMKQTLFGAQSPEGARLVKTQLEGAMYERLPRYGRMVALPKPFVFSVASVADRAQRCSVIFYDNAGEHFQPGRDSADSPGAQHVASSSGILFLFDPFNNPEFRRLIADRKDPQLERPVLDHQSIILSEMKVRITRLLKLDLTAQIEAPLAVLIGKCDAWLHLLGEEPFRNPVRRGFLDLDAVEENSHILRQLMLRISSPVVANAESISRQALFFPVSSFGHAPVKVGPGDFVPDARRLQPYQVEVPLLWILSRIAPGLVPSRGGRPEAAQAPQTPA